MKFTHLIVVVCMLGGFFFGQHALALTISPVKVEVTGNPGQTLKGEMELLNEQGESKIFFSSFENFEPSGDTGSPHFVGKEDGLATWLQTDASVETLPGMKKVVPYTITIPIDAEPGGYFSAIFWGSQDPRTQEAGEVSIGGKLGVLILLRVAGDIPESAGVSEYGTQDQSRMFVNLPIGFSYRFSNNGGDRVVPLGDIVIKNTFGGTSAVLSANENEGSVLPNSSRKFQTMWGENADDENSSNFFTQVKKQFRDFHFGIYSAHLEIVWGATNQVSKEVFYFTIIPWQLLIVVLVLIILGVFSLKKYNSWIIGRSNVAKKG